jgi:tRNA threonylcarbamoyladenosine biosynthesis protein TsaE
MRELITHSPEETTAAGEAFAATLRPGDCVALIGDLGAGKTHFVKGLCRGLGVPDAEARVTSPTFILVNEYAGGRLPVFHLDAYRLSGAGELWEIGFDEMLDAGGVVLVEWADRVPEAIPATAKAVRFEHGDGDRRRLVFTEAGSRE